MLACHSNGLGTDSGVAAGITGGPGYFRYTKWKWRRSITDESDWPARICGSGSAKIYLQRALAGRRIGRYVTQTIEHRRGRVADNDVEDALVCRAKGIGRSADHKIGSQMK